MPSRRGSFSIAFRASVSETLARKAIENDPAREGGYRFLTTGDPEAFREMGSRFLQLPIADVERVHVAELEKVAA